MPNTQRLVADMEAIPDVTADLARIREMDAAWTRAADAMGRFDFAAFDREMVAFRAARDGAK